MGRMRRPTALTLLATSLLACGADKGAEDEPLSEDGKADSFYKPTEHGQLVFDAPNAAAISDAERFHSWTFTLTDEATVSLRTAVSNNLDTVMYLYRRDAGSTGSFGSYIEKNDDHEDDSLYSQIDLDAGAGEYRVVVKAFKTAMKGPFELGATCTGAGCPGPSACVADQFGTMPSASAMISEACATSLIDGMSTRSTTSNTTTVTESQTCSLDGVAKRSADLYRAYWQDLTGWDDFKGGDANIALEVTTTAHGMATEVTVDAPYDEDSMTFVYGPGGTLLSLYQSNQSPDAQSFCSSTGTVAAPDASCMEYMRGALTHATAEMTASGTTTCTKATTDLPPLADSPVCEWRQIGCRHSQTGL